MLGAGPSQARLRQIPTTRSTGSPCRALSPPVDAPRMSEPINLAAPGSLSHLQWRATEYLLAFGPLRSEIVLDYFIQSPFFDRTSNNATLRMQMQFSRGGMHDVNEDQELKSVQQSPQTGMRGS